MRFTEKDDRGCDDPCEAGSYVPAFVIDLKLTDECVEVVLYPRHSHSALICHQISY